MKPKVLSCVFNWPGPRPKAATAIDGSQNPRFSPLRIAVLERMDGFQAVMSWVTKSFSSVAYIFVAMSEPPRRVLWKIEVIDKPTPWDDSFQERRQIPADEHLIMPIASQV